MPRVVLVLAVLAATIFCIIDCIQSDQRDVRNLPKIVWVLVILIAPVAGSTAWLIAGRPRSSRARSGPQRPQMPTRPTAPDDDPMFLAGLDRTNDERRRLEALERELEARERELRNSSAAGDDVPPEDSREKDGPGDEPATRT